MMHIQEYVESVNNTFDEVPFNDVDALVLCSLFYGRIEHVIEGENKKDNLFGVPVREFYKQEYFPAMFSDGIQDNDNKMLLTAAAASPRFRNVKVFNVEARYDADNEVQFAAAIYSIDAETDFVCFRGTDGTLTGWKEDFNMVFMDQVPAQKEAVNYLNRHYGILTVLNTRNIYVGGHSKGGNLAIYSSTFCKDHIKNRLKTVYSFDGPGFNEGLLKTLQNAWAENAPAIKKIVPKNSIIGSLMADDQKLHVIKSSAFMILQHSPYSWEIDGLDFEYAGHLSNSAEILDDTITTWVNGASDEQRQIFVDVIFRIFKDHNIETVNDLKAIKPSYFAELVESYKEVDPASREVIRELIHSLFRSAVKANVKNAFH